MKKILNTFFLIFVGTVIIVADQLTKLWALQNCKNELVINNFLSCHQVFNPGISWSLFDNLNSFGFWSLTFFIFLIIVALSVYAYRRFKEGYNIIAEILVISGAASNLVDRILYNAVVDFIILHYGEWKFPVFNIADSAITFGVFLMLFNLFTEK
ncbi:signal peptidase II [Candidatus Dependentiae bacterium]|nr:signal peptidase II [Candidatus Dependentiae bacterium]